ncbi:MAG: hypothetical protein K2X06_12360 [Burkholderiales bacterium]|nr:hypothetical protein [Burkholderiales bacterium]
MKYPLIIAALILPAALLAACKPALMPPVVRGDINAVSEVDWKRSPGAMSSGGGAGGPATGISLERTGSLKTPARMPEQSATPVQRGTLPDDLNAADVDRSQQNRSQQARKSLTLQLLHALSAARP